MSSVYTCRGVFSEELVTIFEVEAIASNLFRVFDVGALHGYG